MTKKPNIKDTIELTIERLGIHGEGIGYLNGYTFFIEGALPGEKISATIKETKPKYGTAVLKEILLPSPDREKPICPLFDRCGGCQIMHLRYQKQLEIKRQRVIDALERIGHFKGIDVASCLPSPRDFAYRNKMQLPVKTSESGTLRIGLNARGTHDLVDVDHCFIHNSLGQKVYDDLILILKNSSLSAYDEMTGKGLLRHVILKSSIATEAVLVVLVTNGDSPLLKPLAEEIMRVNSLVKGVVQNINTGRHNVVLGRDNKLLAGIDRIEETICGLKFNISATSFFQVNPWQAENLYNLAIEMADLQPDYTVLDAYCGVGTLSLISASKAKKVIGIEQVREAIDDAIHNAQANHIDNAEFLCGSVEEMIGNLPRFDVAFLNPPRKGCEGRVLQELSRRAISKIVYISCDPATLARDLALLAQEGYKIQKVQPVDMFPQTAHVETTVLLTRLQNITG